MRLFPEPFDLDVIGQALHDDDFLSIANLTVGRLDNWQTGVDQVARLLPLFENREDRSAIYGMVSILVRRANQLPDPAERLAEVTNKLGLLPRSTPPAGRDCPCKPGKCIYPECTCAIPPATRETPHD